MFPKSKATELYCMANDFCKEFTLQQEKYMIEDKKTRHRNKPNRMSDTEIMVIHSGGFRCFKHYYREYVCKHLKHLFPRQVSYNRFFGTGEGSIAFHDHLYQKSTAGNLYWHQFRRLHSIACMP